MSPPAAYSEERIVEAGDRALRGDGLADGFGDGEKFGAGWTLGRETSGEVVLVPRLRAVLEKLNPKLPAAWCRRPTWR